MSTRTRLPTPTITRNGHPRPLPDRLQRLKPSTPGLVLTACLALSPCAPAAEAQPLASTSATDAQSGAVNVDRKGGDRVASRKGPPEPAETGAENDDDDDRGGPQTESLDAASSYLDIVGDPAGGDEALAIGEYAIAIGSASFALGADSIAIGHLSTALGEFSTAIGYGTSSAGLSSVAVGGIALLPEYMPLEGLPPPEIVEMVTAANGENATAVGPGALANGQASLSLGAGSEAIGDLSTAIGLRAQASGGFSMALGAWSVADSLGATALGVSAVALGREATAVGAEALAAGTDATALGQSSFASESSLAVGSTANASALASVAIGNSATTHGRFAVAIGPSAQAYSDHSISAGFHSMARGEASTAIGYLAMTGGYLTDPPPDDPSDPGDGPCVPMPCSLEMPATRDALGAVAMGQFAQAYADNSVALGAHSLASGENSVALGAGSHADRDGVVSVGASAPWYGHGENPWREVLQRQIINVAAGTEEHDAVNVAQLGQFAQVLGGGAALLDGSLTLPAYMLGGQQYSDIGSAFAAVDTRLSALEHAVDDLPAGPPGPPGPPGDPGQPGPPGEGGIDYDADDKRSLTLEGDGGTRIRNVADGNAPGDAVNRRQLDAGDAATLASAKSHTDTVAVQTLNAARSYTDQRFDALDDQFQALEERVGQRLGEQDKRIDSIGAMGTAMMSMSINAANSRSPRGRVAVGAGWQGGESALSVGYARSIGRASFSIGGAFTSGESSAGIGFGLDL